MSTTINSGLELTYPDLDETNWNSTLQALWLAISAHDHDAANNNGALIGAAALAADGVTDASIRLRNNQSLRARNAADAADLNLLKATTGNLLDLQLATVFSSTETAPTASGAISLTSTFTKINGTSLAMTLAAGTEGQVKVITNLNATVASVTPSVTAGSNVVWLNQYGTVMYWYINSEWRAFLGQGATLAEAQVTQTQATTGVTTYNIDVRAPYLTLTGAGTGAITLQAGNLGQQVVVVNTGATRNINGVAAASGVTRVYIYDAAWRYIAMV
jgi:hypothetical protein